MHEDKVWTWRLWGLRSRRLDVLLTVGVASLLGASRLLLLANGPWEQDETLFARALLGFDLAAHFPHPPGFPLWLALGALLDPVSPSPLVSLQVLSAVASILLLWPLAALGRRAAPAFLAAAAAVAVLVLPGVWFHSVRGFASVPAALPAFWAAVIAAGGLRTSKRAVSFFLLLAAAALIRPVLLPPLLALALVGARTAPLRRTLLAGLPALLLLGVSVTVLAARSGGWQDLVVVSAEHGQHHARDLVWNVSSLPQLGWVRGMGGRGPAVVGLAVALAGLAVWYRRSRPQAVSWALVVATGMTQLVLLQNPTHPRYAVPFQLALAPVAAAAAGSLPPPIGLAALLAAGGAAAAGSAPAVVAQHRSPSPVWQAVEEARRHAVARRGTLVVEPAVYPMVSYHEALARRRGEPSPAAVTLIPASDDRNVDPERPPWAARRLEMRRWQGVKLEERCEALLDCPPPYPWIVVTDRPQRYRTAPGDLVWESPPVPESLAALSQGRFLAAAVLDSPFLPLEGWWEPEETPAGEPFCWGRSGARLWVPPAPPGAMRRLRVRPHPGPEPVRVTVNGRDVDSLAGGGAEQVVALPGNSGSGGQPVAVAFQRVSSTTATDGDSRPLAVQWLGAAVSGPGVAWSGAVATPEQRTALGVSAQGLWSGEVFAAGAGCWTQARVELTLPVGPGTVWFVLSAPRPGRASVRISCDGTFLVGETVTGEKPVSVAAALPASCLGNDRVTIDLEALPPYRPALAGLPDPRELGVVLHRITYSPRASDPASGKGPNPAP